MVAIAVTAMLLVRRARAERWFTGAVVAVITTLLLLLTFLDDPFQGDDGGLPT